MAHSAQTLEKSIILACIDGSNVTQSICDYANWYGEKLALPVALLHVVNVPKSKRHDLSGIIGMDSSSHLKYELTRLDEQTSRVANQHGDLLLQDAKTHILSLHEQAEVFTHLRRGKLLPAIEHFSKRSRLIILGRRGEDHQGEQMTLGSQIETVVRAMNNPILICSAAFKTPDSFMLAFDGSPTAKKAVKIICDSQIAPTIKGHIVMVGHGDTDLENELYKARNQMQKSGLNVTAHLIDTNESRAHDGVVSALLKFQEDHFISIIVLGAYGHAKWRRFFVGSTTTKLLTKTTSPVLLLR